MAAIPPARTRSLRAAGPSLNRSQQQQQQGSNGASATAPTRRQQPAAGAEQGPSPSLSLFLTNLRLLDLDLSPDWPGITASTFTVTGSGAVAAQAQKRRVACVEWSLYRLFEIYDAEEARRLKMFFPPVDQVASVNLRAALLRALEAVKKSGVLGKDVVLRKTILDDCRGERVEEVLASFSTAVLRSVVAAEESGSDGMPAAVRMALEIRGYQDEKMDLVVMSTAYRVALKKMLERRAVTGGRYKDFEELLTVRERGIKRRMEEVRALNEVDGNRTKVSRDAVEEVRSAVRHNWAGNEGWMHALMHGDGSSSDKKGVFGMEFERVWRRVEAGRCDELETGGEGLVEGLERRGRGVSERVKRWESFRASIGGPRRTKDQRREARVAGVEERKGLDLGFGEHEKYKVGGEKVEARELRLGGTNDLKTFAQDLERDLDNAGGGAVNPLQTLGWLFERSHVVSKKVLLKPDESHEAVSEISDFEEEIREEVVPVPSRKLDGTMRGLARPKLTRPASTLFRDDKADDEVEETREAPGVVKRTSLTRNAPRLPRPGRVVSFETDAQDAPRSLPVRTRSIRNTSGSRSRSASPEKQLQEKQLRQQRLQREKDELEARRQREEIEREQLWGQQERDDLAQDQGMKDMHSRQSEPIDQEQGRESISPTQDLADEILENMKNASPSPAKTARHKLSLAERTRLSMARGSLLFAEEEEDETGPQKDRSPPAQPEQRIGEEKEPAEDLVSRTRRSMAGFEKARQKAQMERRKSLRRSRLPGQGIKEGSYFDKIREDEEGERERRVLEEELMREEVEEEMVFRSRPKVKDSPVGSPTREW